MLFYCWASVADAVPTVKQHRDYVSRWLCNNWWACRHRFPPHCGAAHGVCGMVCGACADVTARNKSVTSPAFPDHSNKLIIPPAPRGVAVLRPRTAQVLLGGEGARTWRRRSGERRVALAIVGTAIAPYDLKSLYFYFLENQRYRVFVILEKTYVELWFRASVSFAISTECGIRRLRRSPNIKPTFGHFFVHVWWAIVLSHNRIYLFIYLLIWRKVMNIAD